MWRWILGILGTIVVVVGLFWLVAGVFLNSAFVLLAQFGNEFWTGALFPNGWNLVLAAPLFWIFVIIALAIGAYALSEVVVSERTRTAITALSVVVIVLLSAHVVNRWFWFNEDQAKSYMASSQYIVDDPSKLPSVIAKTNPNTVQIKKGTFSFSWDARSASATGASIVLQRTSSGVGNTTLLTDTLEYLYNKNGTGTWTAIRNGKNQQSIYSVATWDGKESNAKECLFTGSDSLHYTFGGLWGTNLTDKIAAAYPRYMYNMNDVWGYCKDGTSPTIVIPLIAHHGYNTLITDRAAGVLVINGSASGEPVIKHLANVKSGELPGPVYPSRLEDRQRDSLNWAAGWNATVNQGYGFDTTTDAESQAGNTADYLLKSKSDGHLYWVTPMKPSSTDTQTIVAYSITRADETTFNKLNQQRVYLPRDGDLRAVNLDSMKASVSQALKTTDPGFFTGSKGSAGSIAEFLPLTDTVWQVFAEQSGRVVYRIDVSVDSQIVPKIYDLTGTAATLSGGTCDNPTKLTNQQLVACLNAVVSELNTRKLAGVSDPTPTPTPTK